MVLPENIGVIKLFMVYLACFYLYLMRFVLSIYCCFLILFNYVNKLYRTKSHDINDEALMHRIFKT